MKLFECETVELKEIYTPDLKKEIVAFSNTKGGTIYIGVQDIGEIIGLDNTNFVMQQISKWYNICASIRRCYSYDDKND